MPQLSLTDFVDIVSKSGTPKATKVREVKYRPAYTPASDYYKKIKHAIIACHKHNLPISTLEDAATNTSKHKIQNYMTICNGYTKWLSAKKTVWISPPCFTFEHAGVAVNINPELGLSINNQYYYIKLYFKAEKLTKNRIDIINYLMKNCLCGLTSDSTSVAVLDIRNSRLIKDHSNNSALSALIKAELSYISSLWDDL
ncbi:hypothetical protein [Desulfovibrio sp. TomC]|uniref:hypothetical protein n=1 Tax=Desulfovibrio sp. TomC TaxID=1562888 RepID=UPI0012E2A89F|nr:hypothetical protein [Desulfovibrio sp. TomC]